VKASKNQRIPIGKGKSPIWWASRRRLIPPKSRNGTMPAGPSTFEPGPVIRRTVIKLRREPIWCTVCTVLLCLGMIDGSCPELCPQMNRRKGDAAQKRYRRQLPLHTFELRSAEVHTQRRGLVWCVCLCVCKA
jgi:hypothetical protein